jgi:beta/gamma crystallin
MTIIHTGRQTCHVAAWAVLIAVAAFGVSTSAQFRQDSGSRMTVYADVNFGGQSVTFNNDMPNLVAAGWNDNISSLRIPNGETWEICQDVDYGNRCQSVSGSVSDLRSIGWNDRISSLRRINDTGYRDRRSGVVIGTTGTGTTVTVYADPNFRGQSASFRDDTPNLVSYNMNDKISSIRIPDGDAWEVCQDIDYGNQCQVLTSSVADLRSMGWSDRISSLHRVNNAAYRDGGYNRDRRQGGASQSRSQQGLMFFDRPNYRGRSTLVTSGFSSRTGFPSWQGSIQLRGGSRWEVCDSSGNCAAINEDVSDVSVLGLNDRITSVRLMNPDHRDRK